MFLFYFKHAFFLIHLAVLKTFNGKIKKKKVIVVFLRFLKLNCLSSTSVPKVQGVALRGASTTCATSRK